MGRLDWIICVKAKKKRFWAKLCEKFNISNTVKFTKFFPLLIAAVIPSCGGLPTEYIWTREERDMNDGGDFVQLKNHKLDYNQLNGYCGVY